MSEEENERREFLLNFAEGMYGSELDMLLDAVMTAKVAYEFGEESLEMLAFSHGLEPICPDCGEKVGGPYAFRAENLQPRYRCSRCGRHFVLLSGSALASCKMPFWKLCYAVKMMMHNATAEEIADILEMHVNTAMLLRRKVFETLSDWQSKVRLHGRVYIDEIYTFDSAIPRDHFKKNVRGLNRSKCCVFLAVDCRKNMIAFTVGHGKPTKKEIEAALLPHLSDDVTVIVHDGERAHRSSVSESGASDEIHLSSGGEESLRAMALINNFCGWVKRFLDGYVGMDTEYLQDYLNWYVYLFRCKKSDERWPSCQRVVRHLIMERCSLKRKDLPGLKAAKREELESKGRRYGPKNLEITQKIGRYPYRFEKNKPI